jgi:malate dehydrogenase (oxaloacetate-decarboxylating)
MVMVESAYELGDPTEGYPVRIRARGRAVLANPMLNRGTAFSTDERRALDLEGLTGHRPNTRHLLEIGLCA